VHEIFVTSECDLSMIEGSALTLGLPDSALKTKTSPDRQSEASPSAITRTNREFGVPLHNT
jgi:hypothetical protein